MCGGCCGGRSPLPQAVGVPPEHRIEAAHQLISGQPECVLLNPAPVTDPPSNIRIPSTLNTPSTVGTVDPVGPVSGPLSPVLQPAQGETRGDVLAPKARQEANASHRLDG